MRLLTTASNLLTHVHAAKATTVPHARGGRSTPGVYVTAGSKMAWGCSRIAPFVPCPPVTPSPEMKRRRPRAGPSRGKGQAGEEAAQKAKTRQTEKEAKDAERERDRQRRKDK